MRTMIGSGIGVITGDTITGVSGVLMGLLLIIEVSDWEKGINVGPTLGVGTGLDG